MVKEAIRHSNVYFETGIANEVIAEFSPFLCPTSYDMNLGLEMCRHFLPYLQVEAEARINAFIDDMFLLYDSFNNKPTWEWVNMASN